MKSTIFISLFIYTCCTGQIKAQTETMNREDQESSKSNELWVLSYEYAITDGNTNFYLFGYNWFTYFPVKQYESSGRLYSGGKEIKVKNHRMPEEYALLVETIRKASLSVNEHTNRRNMGDMRIEVTDEDGKTITEFILKKNTESLRKVECRLEDMKKKLQNIPKHP